MKINHLFLSQSQNHFYDLLKRTTPANFKALILSILSGHSSIAIFFAHKRYLLIE